MRRLHLIELHEQPWYPAVWREIFQLSLGRGVSLMKPFVDLAPHFRQLIARTRSPEVLELCSGSGEIAADFWEELWKAEAEELDGDRPRLFLSDLYPNSAAYSKLKQRFSGDVDYFPEPVDALEPPGSPGRVWLMIESLHHFRPDEMEQILARSAENAEGFAAFETTQRKWTSVLAVLLSLPVAMLVTAFLLRPFRFRNFLWGMVLPAVPLTLTFDGVVSNLRSYTVEELRAATASITGFEWEAGTVPVSRSGGRLEATYLLGWKRGTASCRQEETPAAERSFERGVERRSRPAPQKLAEKLTMA